MSKYFWGWFTVFVIVGTVVTGILILNYTHGQSFNQIPIPTPTLPVHPVLTPSCTNVLVACP
jgi:hypothetical protein